MTDSNIASQIVSYISNKNSSTLVEIGPGKGILTGFIKNIHSMNKKYIEIDPDCVNYLKELYPEITNDIINKDFLNLDLNIFNKPLSIIGNFPYNISSQILFKIYDNRNIVNEMVGMFQYEVAERICSNYGSKKYGILSVLIQAFFDVKLLKKIKPESFYPMPKVNSGVIRIIKKTNQINCDENLFKKIVKKSFGQRRKTIWNSLKTLNIPQIKKEDTIFAKRPEQLSVSDFIYLTNLVSDEKV